MKNYIAAKFISILLILGGCASGGVKVESRVQSQYINEIKRMLVTINVENRNFNKNIANGMRDSLMAALSNCGIASSVYVKDPLDLYPEQTFSNQAREFKPDAILSIVRTGGQVLITDGGNHSNFDLMMRLSQVSPRAEIWTAKLDVNLLTQNLFTNDNKTGERLGNRFVDAMKKDGVICKGL